MASSENIDDIYAMEIIKRSKELLDKGVITKSEFDEIKKVYLMQLSEKRNETQEKEYAQKTHQTFDSTSEDFLSIVENKPEHKENPTQMSSEDKTSSKIKIPKNTVDSYKNNDINESDNSKPWYYTQTPQSLINKKTKMVKVKSKSSKLSTSSNSKKIKHKTKINSKPKYQNYKLQVNRLESKFKSKEKDTRDLIEKCFPAPQFTNTRFNHNLDECLEIFSHKKKSIIIIINSANDYSTKLEDEIKSDINVLKQIIDKLNSLHDELLIQMSETDNDDFENLLDEMDILINSVKDYNFDN